MINKIDKGDVRPSSKKTTARFFNRRVAIEFLKVKGNFKIK